MKVLLPTFYLKLDRTLKIINNSNILLPKTLTCQLHVQNWSLKISERVNSKDIE